MNRRSFLRLLAAVPLAAVAPTVTTLTAATDAQLGISMRFIRHFDPNISLAFDRHALALVMAPLDVSVAAQALSDRIDRDCLDDACRSEVTA